MLLRKQTAGGPSARDREVVPVLAEPRPGMTTPSWSGGCARSAPAASRCWRRGFVSASIEQGRLAELEDIAEVGIKSRKRPLGAVR